MKIGIEFEVATLDTFELFLYHAECPPYAHREWYYWMIEVNDFLRETMTADSPTGIALALKLFVRKHIQRMKEYAKANGVTVVLSELPVYLTDHRCYVFNGVHIHISTDDKAMLNIGQWDYMYSTKLVSRKIRELGADLRFLTSHHVWGKYRESRYGFKKNDRYKPVRYTEKDTIEIRIFSFADILNHPHKVARIIYEELIEPARMQGAPYCTPDEKRLMRELVEFPSEYEPAWVDLLARRAGIEEKLTFRIGKNFHRPSVQYHVNPEGKFMVSSPGKSLVG